MNNQTYQLGNTWMTKKQAEKARGIDPAVGYGKKVVESPEEDETPAEGTVDLSSAEAVSIGQNVTVVSTSDAKLDKDEHTTYTVDSLKATCDEKGIKYHHASGMRKLKELLEIE